MRITLSMLALVVLVGCASPTEKQALADTQQVASKRELDRLLGIYRTWFERGFLEAWAGHSGVIETTGLVSKPTDPEGEMAKHDGWGDGQEAGSKALRAYAIAQAGKNQQ